MGGDFFRLPEASEVITKRRLFAGRRTRIILPPQKARMADKQSGLRPPHSALGIAAEILRQKIAAESPARRGTPKDVNPCKNIVK